MRNPIIRTGAGSEGFAGIINCLAFHPILVLGPPGGRWGKWMYFFCTVAGNGQCKGQHWNLIHFKKKPQTHMLFRWLFSFRFSNFFLRTNFFPSKGGSLWKGHASIFTFPQTLELSQQLIHFFGLFAGLNYPPQRYCTLAWGGWKQTSKHRQGRFTPTKPHIMKKNLPLQE